jgi:hypothetical protein
MSDINRDALLQEADSLSHRMGAHLQEFRNRSELAQLRGQLTRLAERHRQLRNRLQMAEGPAWEASRNEFAREHSDLLEEFVKFEEKLDRDERLRPGRAPGAKSGLV